MAKCMATVSLLKMNTSTRVSGPMARKKDVVLSITANKIMKRLPSTSASLKTTIGKDLALAPMLTGPPTKAHGFLATEMDQVF